MDMRFFAKYEQKAKFLDKPKRNTITSIWKNTFFGLWEHCGTGIYFIMSSSDSEQSVDTGVDDDLEVVDCDSGNEGDLESEAGDEILLGPDPYSHEPVRGNIDVSSSSDEDMEEDMENIVPEGRTSNKDWCCCGLCILLETDEMYTCCKELSAIPPDSFSGVYSIFVQNRIYNQNYNVLFSHHLNKK